MEDSLPGGGVSFLASQLGTSKFVLCGNLPYCHHGPCFFLLDRWSCLSLFSMAMPEVGMGQMPFLEMDYSTLAVVQVGSLERQIDC